MLISILSVILQIRITEDYDGMMKTKLNFSVEHLAFKKTGWIFPCLNKNCDKHLTFPS
jgi:hypothetical protein